MFSIISVLCLGKCNTDQPSTIKSVKSGSLQTATATTSVANVNDGLKKLEEILSALKNCPVKGQIIYPLKGDESFRILKVTGAEG